ncbi:alpha/beta hydrolase [Bacteroidota bacterium]
MIRIFYLSYFLILCINPLFAQIIKFENEYAIWSGSAPGSEKENYPSENYAEKWINDGNELVQFITDPTIRVFPPKGENRKTALIICPGGGYNILVIDREGYNVAKYFANHGITAIVLKYRHFNRDYAMHDALRAIKYVRSKANEWNIDPNKIGIGGFSAGGHLSVNAAINYESADSIRTDEMDNISDKPDFTMLIYPGLVNQILNKLDFMERIDRNFPPSFIVVADDDKVTPATHCIDLYNTLSKFEIPTELHIYQQGGHGFDMGNEKCNCDTWPELFLKWLENNNF